MTLTEMIYDHEALADIWDYHLPLTRKIEILRSHFKVKTLATIPFWDLYRIVKKLNSF